MAAAKQIVVRQVRGLAGESARTRSIITALGLGRIGKEKTFTSNPALQGMLNRCAHLVQVVEGGSKAK